MICIYKQDNNNYTNNGDAVLIPTVCDLAMTINGAWQLKIEHPYDPEERYKLITEGAIIRIELECIAELETVYQLFRVYQYTKGLHSIEAIAFPVAMESTYDAPIDNLVISGKTGAQAMAQLQTFTNKYTLISDVTATGSSSYNNTNINEAIASGNDNSFIQVWGGEILYDNYKFKVKTRLGDDTAGDHRVMYGRNLTNIEYEKDDSGIITRISPISQDNIRLDGTGYVDSSHISDYPVAHHKYETAPYTLVDTEATSPSQTATLTRQAVAAVSAQADTLSHSAWTTASGAGYQPEYIKSIKTEITEAVQNMALANVASTSLYNLMKTTIANAMAWLGDLKQPKWEWMGSDQTGWKYGNATSYAKNMYVKIGKTWSYFGSDGNWQEPKDDSDEWDWHDVKNGTGKKYGNFNKYFAHNEYVYITQSGTIKEYWFNEQGWFEEDESGDSEYYWHGSGTGADPYWFGKDSSTYLKSCWRFIDGTYYFFDSYGYVAAQKDNYQWDWVESGDASRAWFGNAINSEYGSEGSCLKSQWEKINGTWYYFDANGIVQSEAVSQTNAIAVFTTGMSGLTTTVDNWKGQLYSLLYSLMRSYCTWRFKQKIDLPAITIKVDMADLSKTEEYKDFADLEKIRLGDSVECIDYEHNISTTNRVIGITYDCILKSNKDITIGEAAATVAQMVGNAQGEAVTGGFDTSALETQLTALRNGKQDKLTAGENITIVNDVISATGGGHGDCTCYYGVGAPKSSLGNDGDIYADISPDESGCKALTYHRSSNLHDVTANASEGIYDINGSWWTDRYEHTYTLYSISGLTAGEVYTVSFRLKFNRAMTFYDNDEFIGIAVHNSGSCEYRSNPPRNGEFKSYLDTQYKVYIQSVKTTAEWQSYTFEFTAMNANYLGLYFDGIVNGEDFDVDIDNLYISDGTIGDSLTDLYVKVDGEWLVYDNGTHYVAGSNITITKVDGQMVISATDTTYNNFVGATSENNGSAGLVPAPQTSERNKYLKGDGTWAEVQGASAVSDLTDVSLNNLSNNQILKWNSTTQKWENSSGGGGGSDVEANPSDPATDTLNTIGIDGTVYNIAGGGGGTSGGSAYTETVLWENSSGLSFKPNDSKTVTLSDSLSKYDAISFVFGGSSISNSKATFLVLTSDLVNYSTEGVLSICMRGSVNYNPITYYVDNTHITFGGWTNSETAYAYKVVGLKYGGNLSPVIYSTEEREIGVWTDNKPLYQKTITLTSKQAQIDISGLNIDTYVKSESVYRVGDYVFEMPRVADSTSNYDRFISVYYTVLNSGYISLIWGNSVSSIDELHITLQYTKTTDVAGSGSYNTLGVPTVHYTTDEQVIGTWLDGKPLYRRTWNFTTPITVNSNSWADTDIAVASEHINMVIGCDAVSDAGAKWNFISATTDLATTTYVRLLNIRNNGVYVKYLTLEYTKTTD